MKMQPSVTAASNRWISRYASCSFYLLLFVGLVTMSLAGCRNLNLSEDLRGCKTRAQVNSSLLSFIKARFKPEIPVRIAVLPFEVQESFSSPANNAADYGQTLATQLQSELMASGELQIVEFLDRRWSGKRDDFARGNYQAIENARQAGYDFVIVGQLEPMAGESSIVVEARVIDVANGITLYRGETVAYSDEREANRFFAKTPFVRERPDYFYYPERTRLVAHCIVEEILRGQPVP